MKLLALDGTLSGKAFRIIAIVSVLLGLLAGMLTPILLRM